MASSSTAIFLVLLSVSTLVKSQPVVTNSDLIAAFCVGYCFDVKEKSMCEPACIVEVGKAFEENGGADWLTKGKRASDWAAPQGSYFVGQRVVRK
uniref:Uncharacterized protein n=1 Tax=Plectus sambesii TaxID=2011161 RepID=A0A914X537_9BILA